jgi:hypothetical protein
MTRFPTHGIVGIVLVILSLLNFYFKIQPFSDWYFPIIWLGYILFIDGLTLHLSGNSMVKSFIYEFILMFFLSVPLWYVFEYFNVFILNWSYTGGFTPFVRLVSSAFLLPALYVTYIFLRELKWFDHETLKKELNISDKFIYLLLLIGVVSFSLPILFPKYTFPLVWLIFFFLLDPLNYVVGQPSILSHLQNKRISGVLYLLLSGLIVGFLWEFWNYWATSKWIYILPSWLGFKIFEMPILGYLGYLPFAIEMYVMYWTLRGLLGLSPKADEYIE